MMEETTRERGSAAKGLAICWGCNILQLIVGWMLFFSPPAAMVVFGGIGLVQLAYVIPFCRHFKSKGQTNVVNGLIIAASITALLNAGCWTTLTFFR